MELSRKFLWIYNGLDNNVINELQILTNRIFGTYRMLSEETSKKERKRNKKDEQKG